MKEVYIVINKAFESYLNSGPVQTLWAFMLLAQHYYYISNLDKASEYISKAIDHTPTLHELYLIKAKILSK